MLDADRRGQLRLDQFSECDGQDVAKLRRKPRVGAEQTRGKAG